MVGDLDTDHYLRVTKTRYEALDGRVIHKPGAEFAEDLLGWLEFGEKPAAVDWDAAIGRRHTRDDLNTGWQQATPGEPPMPAAADVLPPDDRQRTLPAADG